MRFARSLLLALTLSTGCANAVDDVTISLHFKPDLKNGLHLYEICATCHLPEGWGNKDGTYPQLAGQHKNVLIKQLLDIRTGERDNALMYPFVQQRTLGGYQEMADVVAYISTLPMHPQHEHGPWAPASPEYVEGEKVYGQYCTGCHGEKGEGNNALVIPKLHGQNHAYTRRQILAAKSGYREVSVGMKAVIDQLSEEQLEHVVNFVSYLPVPEKDKAPSLNWRNTDFN
ncbi:MAG: c-type cytochrome [Gammaproteobacteria bacterium]